MPRSATTARPGRLAELAEDEIILRWVPAFPSYKHEPAGWRFPCPCCGSDRELSVQAKPGRRHPLWDPKCTCDPADVGAKLAALGLIVGRRQTPRRRPVDDGALVAIIEDKTLPPNALRVALLRELGMTAAEIRVKLALPRSTYYDTVRILGQRRRSA